MKEKAFVEYNVLNVFCIFRLFIGNKYKILLTKPVLKICISNSGNIYKPNETASADIGERIKADTNNVTPQQSLTQSVA